MIIAGKEDMNKAFKEELKNLQVMQGIVSRHVTEKKNDTLLHVEVKVIKNGFSYFFKLKPKDIAEHELSKEQVMNLLQKGDVLTFEIKDSSESEIYITTKRFFNLIEANQQIRGANYTVDPKAKEAVDGIEDYIKTSIGTLSPEAKTKMGYLLDNVGMVAFLKLLNEEIKNIDVDPSITLMNRIEVSAKERECL